MRNLTAGRAATVYLLTLHEKNLFTLATGHQPGPGWLPIVGFASQSKQNIAGGDKSQQHDGVKQQAFFYVQINIHGQQQRIMSSSRA